MMAPHLSCLLMSWPRPLVLGHHMPSTSTRWIKLKHLILSIIIMYRCTKSVSLLVKYSFHKLYKCVFPAYLLGNSGGAPMENSHTLHPTHAASFLKLETGSWWRWLWPPGRCRLCCPATGSGTDWRAQRLSLWTHGCTHTKAMPPLDASSQCLSMAGPRAYHSCWTWASPEQLWLADASSAWPNPPETCTVVRNSSSQPFLLSVYKQQTCLTVWKPSLPPSAPLLSPSEEFPQ